MVRRIYKITRYNQNLFHVRFHHQIKLFSSIVYLYKNLDYTSTAMLLTSTSLNLF